MQVLQRNRTILTSCQVLFDQIAFAVHFRTISRYDICSCINIVNRIFLSAVLVVERSTVLIHICSRKYLAFFIDGKFCQLFFIRYRRSSCLICHQFHIVSSCIDPVSIRCSDFFQINGFLRLHNLNRRCSVFIRCRHFRDQLCASLIFIKTKYRSCQFCVSLFGVHFHNRYLCFIQFQRSFCLAGFW